MDLLRRIRWINVARALAVAAVVALLVAWPHLRGEGPPLPPEPALASTEPPPATAARERVEEPAIEFEPAPRPEGRPREGTRRAGQGRAAETTRRTTRRRAPETKSRARKRRAAESRRRARKRRAPGGDRRTGGASAPAEPPPTIRQEPPRWTPRTWTRAAPNGRAPEFGIE